MERDERDAGAGGEVERPAGRADEGRGGQDVELEDVVAELELVDECAGVLAEVLVEEGKTVAINTVVARIKDGDGAAAAPPKAEAAPAPAPPAPAPAAPAPAPAPASTPAPAAKPGPAWLAS